MKQIFLFILLLCIVPKSIGQSEFSTKFKAIPPVNIKPTTKKEIVAKSDLPKLNLPKIIAPNVFVTKPKPNNAFEIGTPENHFSMTPKNKFEHKLGDVYQNKMTKDLDKTMVREGLKEDNSFLDRTDRYLGDFRTKSNFLVVTYRDYIQIDGDLFNVYLNDQLIHSQLYLNYELGEFKISLSKGINKVEFVVASQGTSGGNTAEIHVIDDASKSVTDEYWNNLALGTKIKLIVVKE
jgi:hypothetical protein